jgi:BlaI family penicillinase repressor
MLRAGDVPELGPLEFRLLRILWKKAPATARDVLDCYNRTAARKLKYTTIMTLLTRMVEKRVLTVERTRQPFHFSASVGREQMLRQRLREFVDLFFDGSSVDLALRLVQETPLSEESIQRLEETLHRQKQSGEQPEQTK